MEGVKNCHRIAKGIRGRWLLLMFVGFSAYAEGDSAREHQSQEQVQAVFLYQFSRYVHWPKSAPKGDFVICTYGKTAVTDHLREIATKKTTRGRALRIATPAEPENVQPCHIVFIAPDSAARVAALLTYLGDRPILTVGNSRGLTDAGVMLNFFLREGKVRFDANAEKIDKSGLFMSTQLWKLMQFK